MESVIRKGGVQKSKISSAALLHIISTVRLRKALRVMCYACCLGAKPFPGLRPRQGRPKTEISHQRTNFRKSDHFVLACPDLSCKRNFSKTHRRTQGYHSWTSIDLTDPGKLLRGQTNTQMLSYLHFSNPLTPIFDSPFEIKFPLPLYYSRAGSSLLRHR